MNRPRSFSMLVIALLLIALGFAGSLATRGTSSALQEGGMATPEAAPAVMPGGTLPGNPSIQLVQVATGLVDPINVAHAGDGSGRLFIVERIGRVRILNQDGSLVEEPFLDIQETVKTDFLEQGLLGLAFHPDYANNGLFYVYYADYTTNGNLFIVQYNVSADNPDMADPASAKLILSIEADPYVNHNGGEIAFGPDGFLY